MGGAEAGTSGGFRGVPGKEEPLHVCTHLCVFCHIRVCACKSYRCRCACAGMRAHGQAHVGAHSRSRVGKCSGVHTCVEIFTLARCVHAHTRTDTQVRQHASVRKAPGVCTTRKGRVRPAGTRAADQRRRPCRLYPGLPPAHPGTREQVLLAQFPWPALAPVLSHAAGQVQQGPGSRDSRGGRAGRAAVQVASG